MVAPTAVVLIGLLGGVLSFVWYYGGGELWRERTEDRFVYGVPWGTFLAVGLVVAFYLVVQHGLSHWHDPLVLPFVSWSYFYPVGVLTSGFAHGSPAHLTGNMTATLVFGVVAEYVWGHYPPARRDDSTMLAGTGRLSRPLVRILVVPGTMFGVALLTAIFSMGPALGFSGSVFAIAGFAIVTRPRAAIAGIVATSALGTLYQALVDPVVRGTVSAGPPSPPSWASIAFQAHMLGFVVGAALGIGLLYARRRELSAMAVFFGTLAFGLALSLWLIAWPAGDDVFYLYRGAGVIVVVILTGVITVAAAGSEARTPRSLAFIWLALDGLLAGLFVFVLALGVFGIVPSLASGPAIFGTVLLLAVLLALALPAIPVAIGGRIGERFTTYRGTAHMVLIAVAVVLMIPGVLYSPIVVDDATVTATNDISVGDYTITYAENVSSDRELAFLDLGNESLTNETYDGLIVVSEKRQLWTVAESKAKIAFDGNGSVQVGGLGWRETVHADRTGWDVTGNESAYVVDLTVDGETTRSFTADPVRADVRIDGYRLTIVPTAEDFRVRVTQDGETVGTTPIPTGNETATIGPLEILTETDDGTTELVVESDGSSVTVAEKESY